MVVEEGNDDGKFSDAATDAGIPITMLYTIADAVTPLQEIFGAEPHCTARRPRLSKRVGPLPKSGRSAGRGGRLPDSREYSGTGGI